MKKTEKRPCVEGTILLSVPRRNRQRYDPAKAGNRFFFFLLAGWLFGSQQSLDCTRQGERLRKNSEPEWSLCSWAKQTPDADQSLTLWLARTPPVR
jgi:hypothetical protein